MEATKKSNHGANVRRWREWRNINQDVLAERIGVSQATLCGYERKEKLDAELLEKIAKALDIPVEAITELESGSSINIVTNTFQDYAAVNNYPTFNPIDKIVELCEEKNVLYERMLKEYERMLKEKESVIELLQEVAKGKR